MESSPRPANDSDWPDKDLKELVEIIGVQSFLAQGMGGSEPITSLQMLADAFDEAAEEDHANKLTEIVSMLPEQPRAKKLLKSRAKQTVAMLLQKLRAFHKIDASIVEDGRLSLAESRSAAAQASGVRVKGGRSLADAFVTVDVDGDGKVDFVEFYLNTELTDDDVSTSGGGDSGSAGDAGEGDSGVNRSGRPADMTDEQWVSFRDELAELVSACAEREF